MSVTEEIYQHLQKLPQRHQVEVLDFVEYLESKAKREIIIQDDLTWSDISLSLAMRGMEDEDAPNYTTVDLKEVFS
ncbi:MAG: DUF2281 domain-containing protein [bacterium]|nr:DUF2281 domain-containing protein [bacterium]